MRCGGFYFENLPRKIFVQSAFVGNSERCSAFFENVSGTKLPENKGGFVCDAQNFIVMYVHGGLFFIQRMRERSGT